MTEFSGYRVNKKESIPFLSITQKLDLPSTTTGNFPPPVSSQLIYNENDKKLYLANGSAWNALSTGSAGLTSVVAGNGLSSVVSGNVATVSLTRMIQPTIGSGASIVSNGDPVSTFTLKRIYSAGNTISVTENSSNVALALAPSFYQSQTVNITFGVYDSSLITSLNTDGFTNGKKSFPVTFTKIGNFTNVYIPTIRFLSPTSTPMRIISDPFSFDTVYTPSSVVNADLPVPGITDDYLVAVSSLPGASFVTHNRYLLGANYSIRFLQGLFQATSPGNGTIVIAHNFEDDGAVLPPAPSGSIYAIEPTSFSYAV